MSLSDVQYKIRQQALQNASNLEDLADWEIHIKEKESSLKKSGSGKRLPPPRGLVNSVTELALVKEQLQEQHGNHWEGGNEKVSQEDRTMFQQKKIEREERMNEKKITANTLSNAVAVEKIESKVMGKTKAEIAREEGNDLFRAGKFSEAVERYTESIRLDNLCVAALSNRAMVYLKLSQFAAAETDCAMAIFLDPKCAKAYFRRGIARRELGKVAASYSDFEIALGLAPQDKQVKFEFEKLKQSMPIVPKFKKIEIIESESLPLKAKLSLNAEKKNENAVFTQTPTSASEAIEKIAVIKDNSVGSILIKPIAPPKTSLEWEKRWIATKLNSDSISELLATIKISDLAYLIGMSFDSDYISAFLKVVRDVYLPYFLYGLNFLFRKMNLVAALDLMNSLSKVKRFSMLVPFLHSADKAICKQVIGEARKQSLESYPPDQLDNLAKAYMI